MEEQKLLKRKRKAISDNNKSVLISSSVSLADYYFKEHRFELAAKEYEYVAKKYKELKNSIEYAHCNRMIGEAYTNLREYSKALKYQEVHLKIAIEENSKLEEQRALATIGHTYLTSYLDLSNRNALNFAEKFFKKSLAVCEKLTGISQHEHMDMTARLLANLGAVHECLGNYDKGVELVQKSIGICKIHEIWEQLERAYTLLASIYGRKGDFSNAIHNYNLAIEVAGRLEDKIVLISTALISKAEILVKIADFHSAKNVLLKAYKMKNPNKVDAEHIEHALKVVAVMCYSEDRLLTVNSNDFKTKKQLYEKLGDGACDLKNYTKGIEYYEKMLQAAIEGGEPEDSMGPCYTSLAQTYSDDEQYEKALEFFQKDYNINRDNAKEGVSSLLSIAETMDLAGRSVCEIEAIFNDAVSLCTGSDEYQLKAKVLSKQIELLQKYNLLSKAEEVKKELVQIGYTPSDTDSEGTDIQTTPNIGNDINIDDITDISDDEDEKLTSRTSRKRSKPFVSRRNIKGETPLHTACIGGNFVLVQKLLEQGHPVNIRDYCGWLPIHEACIYGFLNIVEALIEKGAAINDRGGTLCKGVTPLHDAASNGHLDVIDYLLDKGASAIAKTDSGETALHMLKKWRGSVELDSVTQTYYQSVTHRMTEILKKLGHDKDTVLNCSSSNTALVTETEDCLHGSKKRKQSNYVISSSDDEDMEIDKRTSVEHSSDTDSSRDEFGATKQYQEVMKNLRYRTSDSNTSNRTNQSLSKRAPLLAADEVGDDWLIDDLGRTKKRKTFDNPYTSTTGLKSSTEISSSTTSNNERANGSPIKFCEFNVVDKDFKENREPARLKMKKRKHQISLINAGFVVERSQSPLNITQTPRQQQSQKRKHQVKLTNFTETENVVEADSTTTSPGVRSSNRRVSDNSPVIIDERDEAILFVDVRITDKLYRVPIPYSSRNTLTIKWLIAEAAKRYCRKEYIKPVLELETKNGAVLGEDDYVSILFPLGVTQAEEVIAKVLRWDVPPLIERYREACNIMNISESQILSQALQETLTALDLANYNLSCQTLRPLFKAINRQANFYHLNLSGNFMSTESMELLTSSLPSLENLTILNLSMNNINCDSLSHMANMFTQHGQSILENLVNLDLSYNPLGNASLKYLAIITRHLKLSRLKLTDVDFTSEIFDDISNRNIELYLDYLEELDVSENRMDKDDILKFILWLRPPSIRTLNVSNNDVTVNGLLVEIVRIFEASGASVWNFKNLNFSRCKVTDSEVYELVRLLPSAEHLETLNLSYNADLTAISLRRLFQQGITVQALQLEGCQDILKYFETDDSHTIWNTSAQSNIKKLRLSIDKKINTIECEILTRMWKDKSQEQNCVITELDNFLEMAIC